ncbi:thioredoxin family protein [Sediminibacillus terrae]|uniref:thioredoxin family protein n=1 Tax=Sediminibacillus terrae TaxID=1562106 RepID=UPI0012958C90|nr:thioredoxin family protein [Sediminibacillus terrae]
MQKADTLEEIESQICKHRFVLLLISRPDCSVCQAVRPQIEQLLAKKSKIYGMYINADEVTEFAGAYSVFTVPVVIVLAEGKEMLRKARFIPMGEMEIQLTRLISTYIE